MVVCKLLCCSKAMEELVHSACAGRLVLCLNGIEDRRKNRQQHNNPADSSGWPHEISLCRWLAKHARLCSTLHLTTIWTLQGDSYQPHLKENVDAAGLAAAAGLKELELTIGHHIHEGRFHVPSDLGVFTHLAPALRQLTGLTSLHAPAVSPRPQQLPSSLLKLCAARPSGADRINWQSLRGVTSLLLSSGPFTDGCLQVNDVLPPNLQQLQLSLSYVQDGIPSLLPVLQLPQLTKLVVQMEHDVFPAEVQLLEGMSQLKVLEVSCSHINDERGWLELGQVLLSEALPLQGFSAHYCGSLSCGFPAAAIKPWKHLTSLDLCQVHLQQDIGQLAEQLRHLPALCSLQVCGVTVPPQLADAGAGRNNYEPLVKVIAELPGLRQLVMESMPLRGAVGCLSAATQLRKLSLWHVSMSEEARAALCAVLKPLGATLEILSEVFCL